jgi:hypothetical protein
MLEMHRFAERRMCSPHVPKYVVGIRKGTKTTKVGSPLQQHITPDQTESTALKEHEDYRDFASYMSAGRTVFIPTVGGMVLNLTDTVV